MTEASPFQPQYREDLQRCRRLSQYDVVYSQTNNYNNHNNNCNNNRPRSYHFSPILQRPDIIEFSQNEPRPARPLHPAPSDVTSERGSNKMDDDEILPTISGRNVIMAFGAGPKTYVQHSSDTGICTCLFWSRYSLFSVNCVIWAAGVAMIGLGAWAMVNGAGIDLFKSLLTVPCIMLMVTGCVMVMVGVCGWIGTFKLSIVCLRVFMVLAAAAFVMQLALGAMLFFVMDHIEMDMHHVLERVVREYHTGEDANADETIDHLQETLKCCGASSFSDWESNIHYNCTTTAPSKCGVPTSCCRGVKDRECGYNVRDGTKEYTSMFIYTEGCTISIMRVFREHVTTTAAIAFSITFLDIFAIILASLVIKSTVYHRTLLSQQ